MSLRSGRQFPRRAPFGDPTTWSTPVCLTSPSGVQFTVQFENIYSVVYLNKTCVFCMDYDSKDQLDRAYRHLHRLCNDFRNSGFTLSLATSDEDLFSSNLPDPLFRELSEFSFRYKEKLPATVFSRSLDCTPKPDKNGRFSPETVSAHKPSAKVLIKRFFLVLLRC